MISLDTETTGLDVKHGAKPFLVTTCDEEGNQTFFEWDVDPLTREPQIPESDLREIQVLMDDAELLVLQNPKFDFSAMDAIDELDGNWKWDEWDWGRVRDTLLAGHLLSSNQPHDLTSMSLIYLGINIEPYEIAIKIACNEARRIARRDYPEWRIAKAGLPEMPSAKESVSKFDMWLPRALMTQWKKEWQENDNKESRALLSEHESWWTVCSEYANADSAVTLPLFKRQKEIIEERGLWEIYLERLKVLPIAYAMERRGITINSDRMKELRDDYTEESKTAGHICRNIAKSYGVELELPKSGNNKSLTAFVFGPLGLEPIKKSKKTGLPSFDKAAIDHYAATLPAKSKELTFINTLKAKRKRDTNISYMDNYQRYWLSDAESQSVIALKKLKQNRDAGIEGAVWQKPLWFKLHPSLNPTGTDTLRWSSSNPNEQNWGKQEDESGRSLRYLVGPGPGREWWSCDAKNVELRIPAYEAGERELIDLFEKPNDPPYYGSEHLLNFSTVYPDIWEMELKAVGIEKVGPHCKKKYASTWYQWCKNGDFAVGYQAGDVTADKAFRRPGSRARLISRFVKKDALNKHWTNFAERHGYVETLPDRTVCSERGYPLLCSRTKWGGVLPTVPLNYHVQGSACWVMMRMMIECQDYLDQLNRKYKKAEYFLVMQIHDELVFDFPFLPNLGNLPRLKKIQDLMGSIGFDLVPSIPLPVGIEYHEHTWAEGVTCG